MERVYAECESCGGTGLYCGFAEPKGAAAVCSTCDGTGMQEIRYKPWTGRRKGRRGIKLVKRSWGHGIPITYKQFVRGERPKKDDRE